MEENPNSVLKKYWNYDSFRDSQEEIINALLSKNNVLAILPTGGGKSICYQVPALMLEGVCIVISPLIALMRDQVNALKSRKINAEALIGSLNYYETTRILDNCIFNKIKLLYLSPEKLQSNLVLEKIKQIEISFVAVDEAHCISSWGNDFRPKYRKINVLKEIKEDLNFIALTASATNKVQEDIIDTLSLTDVRVFKKSFKRSNIQVNITLKENKLEYIKYLLNNLQESSIIYVRSRKKTKEISSFLNQNNIKSSFFHGGMTTVEKNKTLTDWLNNKPRNIVATNAFGMGIDKPDVRLVIHYEIPDSVENFYQEIGRAGRDNKESSSYLLINNNDIDNLKKQFLDSLPLLNELPIILKALFNYCKVANNDGLNESYSVDFAKFCNLNKLPYNKVYQVFQFIDRQAIIKLENLSQQNVTVGFKASHEKILEVKKNENFRLIIDALLRNYVKIYNNSVNVNLETLAKKTNLAINQIDDLLQKLSKLEILEYINFKSDLKITFLHERNEELILHQIKKYFKLFIDNKIKQINGIINIVSNNSVCIQKQILNYFGEKLSENCNNCYVCLSNKSITIDENLISKLLKSLKRKPKTSIEIIKEFNFDEKEILSILSNLLEEEQIILNHRNQYKINE